MLLLDLPKIRNHFHDFKSKVMERLVTRIEAYREELEKPMRELWDIRVKAVEDKKRHYNRLIIENKGEERKKAAKEKYEKAKIELEQVKKERELNTNLKLEDLNLFCKVIVLPKPKRTEFDLDIEKEAMRYALEYEKRQGRVPIDVSYMGW